MTSAYVRRLDGTCFKATWTCWTAPKLSSANHIVTHLVAGSTGSSSTGFIGLFCSQFEFVWEHVMILLVLNLQYDNMIWNNLVASRYHRPHEDFLSKVSGTSGHVRYRIPPFLQCAQF